MTELLSANVKLKSVNAGFSHKLLGLRWGLFITVKYFQPKSQTYAQSDITSITVRCGYGGERDATGQQAKVGAYAISFKDGVQIVLKVSDDALITRFKKIARGG